MKCEADCQVSLKICPKKIFRQIEEQKVLFSLESLLGDATNCNKNNFYITNTIKNYFPESKIIIVIRKQDDLLESLYKQSLHGYGYLSIDKFLSEKKGLVSAFDWLTYVDNYIKQFGEKNVLVLPYEQMRADSKSFFNKICRFIEIMPYYPDITKFENRSYSWLSCHIAFALNRFVAGKRWLNRPFFEYFLSRRDKNYIFRILTSFSYRWHLRWFLQEFIDRVFYVKKEFIGKSMRKEIMNIYERSNRALDNKLGLDLGQYNYF